MSRLVARILLAVFMIPAAGVVYFVTYMAAMRAMGYQGRELSHLWSSLTAWGFAAVYFYLLWRGSVRWNRDRLAMTLMAAGGSAVVGFVAFVFVNSVARYESVFVGCVTSAICWLIAVTFVWRETAAERTERLRSIHKSAVVCPSCGYNLTGLQGTRCPECGTLYTLDELFAGQPSRSESEVAD